MAKTNIIISSLDPNLYTTKRLLSESHKLKHSAIYLNPYSTHVSSISKHLKGLYLHRTTGTNYDDFDLVVSESFDLSGMNVSNPIAPLKLFRSKDQQVLFFKKYSLNAIPTLLYRGKITPDFEMELEKLSSQRKYILKMSRGNQGIGVNFLESYKSLTSVLETFHAMKDQKFLIQPFIEHKKEWRLFIIKGEVIACVEKTLSSDDFRGNSKRSTGKILKKIPKDLMDLALMGFTRSGLDYAGVDILESLKGEKLILEINPIPGFEQAEELSGKNIARELITNLL